MTERLKKLIDFLNKAFPNKEQTFFTRNLAGDSMTEIYDHDGIIVDLCCSWGYIEVFGVTYEERKALAKKGFHEDAECANYVDYDFIDAYIANDETEGEEDEADV